MRKKSLVKVAAGTGILVVFFLVGAAVRFDRTAGTGAGGAEDTYGPSPGSPAGDPPAAVAGFEASYVALHRSGGLAQRAQKLWQIMEACRLCPRECGVNRLAGERGFCQAPGTELVVASSHPHYGEERPLVGEGGSGTIFFSHCNLRCLFCQNYEISINGRGQTRSIEELADMMLHLQRIGCHNINVVTPTHYSPHILKALDRAAGAGLRLPVVWNTSGWERLEIVKLLDGVVDIYLPDIKYHEGEEAGTY
jgi:putative pyruvate formate lyase activating enzyme